jgi:hypothetical protein
MSMYRILQQGDGPRLVIASPNDDFNAIRVDDLSALLRLRQRIEQYIFDQQPDGVLQPDDGVLGMIGEYIDTVEARKIAAEAGHRLPSSTIVSACARGTLPGARKDGGRWMVPVKEFHVWLNERSA